MNRGRKLWGSIIIASALMLWWSWNNWGKVAFFTDRVPVITKDVYRGDILTKDMIDYESVKINADYIPARQIEKYLGLEVVQFINKGTPLFREYFSEPEASPNISKDRVYVSLSDENLSNNISRIKKGDKALLCFADTVVLETTVADVDSGKGEFAVMTTREGALKISSMIAGGNKFLVVRG